MPRKYKNISLKTKIRLIKKSAIKEVDKDIEIDELEDIDSRLNKILQITDEQKKNKTNMLFFVMYDISNNKVRTEIAKYLERKGCVRIQKSIFFASAERKLFSEIYNDIKEVQEYYDNNDSVIFVPVSTDEIKSMKIVGQSIDFDIVMNNKNTLFF